MPTVQMTDTQILAETTESLRLQTYPDWSRDELLCHLREAWALCEAVRIAMPDLLPPPTDSQILHAWLNAHKRSRFDRHPRRAAASPRRRIKT